jgi:chromosomal replication initiation ATPase DnaA
LIVMADATQLPLALTIADHARFDTFVGAANEAAVEHVRAVVAGRPDILWLWGAQASGKTHLLQAACRAAAAEERRAMYVPLQLALEPDILGGLDDVDLLALDDVERVAAPTNGSARCSWCSTASRNAAAGCCSRRARPPRPPVSYCRTSRREPSGPSVIG